MLRYDTKSAEGRNIRLSSDSSTSFCPHDPPLSFSSYCNHLFWMKCHPSSTVNLLLLGGYIVCLQNIIYNRWQAYSQKFNHCLIFGILCTVKKRLPAEATKRIKVFCLIKSHKRQWDESCCDGKLLSPHICFMIYVFLLANIYKAAAYDKWL